jgi:hypothetical protein
MCEPAVLEVAFERAIEQATKEINKQHKEEIRIMDDILQKQIDENSVLKRRVCELRKLVKMMAREIVA